MGRELAQEILGGRGGVVGLGLVNFGIGGEYVNTLVCST